MLFFFHLFLIALIAFGCGRTSHSTQKNIFGTDNRVIVTDSTQPLLAIGKLDIGCTGTLIGKRLMLTAGHCIIKDGSLQPKTEFKKFVANMTQGQGTSSATPVRAWIGGATPEQDRTMDWAIVELSATLGESQGTVPISAADITGSLPYTVDLPGYSSDLGAGQSPSVHWGCSIRSVVDGKFRHDCDSTSGISGAPLLAKESTANATDTWKIVGISVSEFRQNLPPPLHRDEWTEGYANVGTPATLFAKVSESLLTTVDVGQAPPTLDPKIIAVTYSVETPIPQPDPVVPVPESFGHIPFQLAQMPVASRLFDNIVSIQDAHWDLIEDSKRFEFYSRQSQFFYYMQASERFKSSLNEEIYAYNVIVRNGPGSVNREYLYQIYVRLKSGQNQLLAVNLNYLPPAIAFETRQLLTILGPHMTRLEAAIFH